MRSKAWSERCLMVSMEGQTYREDVVGEYAGLGGAYLPFFVAMYMRPSKMSESRLYSSMISMGKSLKGICMYPDLSIGVSM
jgi:hypothetical protein